MRTLLTLLLIAFGRAEVRPLLKLRAGAVVVGQPYNAEPVRREDVVVRPAERSSPLESLTGGNEDSMSDAERVYVLQQFAKPAVRTAFIRKVYAIVATQARSCRRGRSADLSPPHIRGPALAPDADCRTSASCHRSSPSRPPSLPRCGCLRRS